MGVGYWLAAPLSGHEEAWRVLIDGLCGEMQECSHLSLLLTHAKPRLTETGFVTLPRIILVFSFSYHVNNVCYIKKVCLNFKIAFLPK